MSEKLTPHCLSTLSMHSTFQTTIRTLPFNTAHSFTNIRPHDFTYQ